MPTPLNAQVLLNRRFAPVHCTYTMRDTLLYALGVGVANEDPLAPATLRLAYERDRAALPTMACALAWSPPSWSEQPPSGIDWSGALHAEESLQMHRPLPAAATLVGQERVAALIDKGAKGALMVTERTLRDARDDGLVATITTTAMLRHNGGFGGAGGPTPAPHPVPADRAPHPVPGDRAPDATLALATRPEQALIYRLSGDLNPLHADPDAAARAGFARPILHGLCTYAVAARALLRLLCQDDPARLQRLDARFVSPVFPGETLRTDVWRDGPGRAAFRVTVVERDQRVLDHGRIDHQ